MLILVLILIFVITVASTWWFGLWSNLITLVNLLLAAMVATSFFENTTFELMMRMKTFASLWPFISVWLLFALTFVILRGVTDVLSGMRLKFDPITEMIGRSVLSLFVAGVFVCFISFTLQLAPLRESLFSGDQRTASGSPIGPDKLWINYIRGRSNGSLSYTAEETMFFPAYEVKRTIDGIESKYEVRTFDPVDVFFANCASARELIAQRETLRLPDDGSLSGRR